MSNVLAAELLKLRKRPAVWLLVGVWLALNLTFAYLFPYLSYRTGDTTGPQDAAPAAQLLSTVLPANLVPNVLGGYPLFGGAIVLILGALMTGSEYGFGTLKTLLIQRPRRVEVLGGILGALVVVVLGLGLASFALSAGASSLVAAAESMPGTFPPAGELARGQRGLPGCRAHRGGRGPRSARRVSSGRWHPGGGGARLLRRRLRGGRRNAARPAGRQLRCRRITGWT